MMNPLLDGKASEAGANGFEQLLEQTMRRSLRDLLGESSTSAIFYHLGLERPAMDAALFHKRLSEVLGAPASIIEELIVKDLFTGLGLVYPTKGSFDLKKCVDRAMDVYASRERRA